MSLLSRDHMIAVLGASSVGLGVRQGSQLRWLGSVGFIDEGPGAWTVALDTLQRLLSEHAPARASVQVLLSAHLCRFCLVPWSEQIQRPDELQAFTHACLEDLYGAPGQAWALALSPAPAGHPRIATAMPQALLEQLRSLAKARRLRLESVQPYLMAAYNRFVRPRAGDDFLFVLAEPQRSVLLTVQQRRWAGVRSVGSADSDYALGALIARERHLQAGSGDAQQLFVHAPARLESPAQVPDAQACGLDDSSLSVRDGLYVMARAVA